MNGTLVPTAVVKRIGEYLLDIHGQFDNRLIFDPAYHVGILDSLTPELQQERRRYDEMYGAWRSLCQQARKLQHDEGEKARMTSILDFQIKEIESAQLQIGEDDELEKKVRAASHAEHIKDNLKEAVFCLEGGERQKGIVEQLETIHRCLEKASAYDAAFADLASKVETLSYEVEDVHDGLMPIPLSLTNGLLTPCSPAWRRSTSSSGNTALRLKKYWPFWPKPRASTNGSTNRKACWQSFKPTSSGRNRACAARPNGCFRCGGKRTPRSVRPWRRPCIN